MNTTLFLGSSWSGPATAWVFGMFWQSALLIVLITALDRFLHRRVAAQVRYALWLLVLLKLLLPPSLALPTGLGYWVGVGRTSPGADRAPVTASVQVVSPESARGPRPEQTRPERPALSATEVAMLLWVAGSVGLLGFVVRRSRGVARWVDRAAPASEALQAMVRDCSEQLGLRRTPEVRLSPEFRAPAVCGLVRPVILLPRGLPDDLSPAQLQSVLLHELFHVKRRDLWVSAAQALLQVLYWWHPGVWYANARIRRVREEAVDESVMVQLGANAAVYPGVLVEIARGALGRSLPALGLIGILESGRPLQQRVRRLLEGPLPRRAGLSPAGWIAVLAVGALLLPMARGQTGEAPAPPSPGQPGVLLDCRMVEADEAAVQELDLGAPTQLGAQGDRGWVLAEPSWRQLLNRVSQPGFETIARPRLVTTDGVTGTISVTRATNVLGRVVHLGPVCELTQRTRSDSVELAIKVTLTELDAQVPAGYAERTVADLTLTAPLGGGVLVLNPTVGAARGKPILFLVEPKTDWVMPEDAARSGGAGSTPADPQSTTAPSASGWAASAVEPPQLLIESRFVMVPPGLVERFRIGTAVAAPDAQGEVRILSPDQSGTLVRELQEAPGADVMSAPRLTTLSGRQAQIQVVEIKTIVTGRASASTRAGDADLRVEQVPLGTTLDVIPSVEADGRTLELTTMVGVRDFLGYAASAAPDAGRNEAGETLDLASRPRFREQELGATRVRLYDGQTLLLSHPQVKRVTREADGSSTAEEAGQEGKRLVVLVTPRLVDPTGTPVHTAEQVSAIGGTLPSQP